jgi:predicted metal-dependent RNase
MCTGGRVLHHLQRFLPDQRSTILLVGYQAAGTRGRSLLDGETELSFSVSTSRFARGSSRSMVYRHTLTTPR